MVVVTHWLPHVQSAQRGQLQRNLAARFLLTAAVSEWGRRTRTRLSLSRLLGDPDAPCQMLHIAFMFCGTQHMQQPCCSALAFGQAASMGVAADYPPRGMLQLSA